MAANTVKAGHALAGFDLSITAVGDDLLVGPGSVDGAPKDGDTLVGIGADGTHNVVLDIAGDSISLVAEATAIPDGSVVLGQVDEASTALSSHTFVNRGNTVVVTGAFEVTAS